MVKIILKLLTTYPRGFFDFALRATLRMTTKGWGGKNDDEGMGV
jgi:hypothetical protein